jgi:hypothetical protein
MWVITKEQMEKIGVSIDEQRKYRAFRILSREDEFAKMNKEELKEKIHYRINMETERRIEEVALLEFIRQYLRDPEITYCGVV